MANIEDYLRWRGDLSFTQDPFNEIDSLILTQLCYLDFEGMIPAWNEKSSISMAKLIEKYWLKNVPAEIEKKAIIIKNPSRMLGALKKSRRFSELFFANYINRVDVEKQEQFSAMTVWIPDGSVYVGYSGTDISLVGWRENLNMSYMDEVPAQLEAVNYLERIYEWTNFKIRLGGHSKGGNLAVYAGIHAREEIAEKILSVDNFDGPGFRKRVVMKPEYSKSMSKVRTYLPETSIVGRLLEHAEVYSVVKSSVNGAWQHDAFTWQVEGSSFVYAKELDLESNMVESTVKLWLEKMDRAEREEFIDICFSILEKAEIKSVEDFTDLKWKTVADLMKAATDLSDKRKKEIRRVLLLLWKQAATVIGQEIKQQMV
ncbi:DUF2974 domain-containing protein [Clostridiales bacterium COT073_COT-073]|nr:DUF2974 domain-containing protein [Clostridiales bacterium COT073_COT-073]